MKNFQEVSVSYWESYIVWTDSSLICSRMYFLRFHLGNNCYSTQGCKLCIAIRHDTTEGELKGMKCLFGVLRPSQYQNILINETQGFPDVKDILKTYSQNEVSLFMCIIHVLFMQCTKFLI